MPIIFKAKSEISHFYLWRKRKHMNQISFYKTGNVEIIIGKGMHAFPYYTHNSYMIGAVLNGCGEFCIGETTSKLNKNDCYIVPSDTGISIKPLSDFSYITICLKNELAVQMSSYEANCCYYNDKRGNHA